MKFSVLIIITKKEWPRLVVRTSLMIHILKFHSSIKIFWGNTNEKYISGNEWNVQFRLICRSSDSMITYVCTITVEEIEFVYSEPCYHFYHGQIANDPENSRAERQPIDHKQGQETITVCSTFTTWENVKYVQHPIFQLSLSIVKLILIIQFQFTQAKSCNQYSIDITHMLHVYYSN